MSNGRTLLSLLVALACCLRASAEPVRYTVSLNNPEKHLMHVAVDLPPGPAVREIQLPVWNALYEVRDFSQFMNAIHASDENGGPLTLTELNPSRWKLEGAEKGARIEYEMFADLAAPFGAQLNPHHAFFNLAEILVYADDARSSPALIQFQNVPQPWKIATPLAQEGNNYAAENYDRLVDSPFELSAFQERDFSAKCGKYRVIVDPDNPDQSAKLDVIFNRIVPSIQRIVNAAADWMNDCPFQTYTFIYHFADEPIRGGMEHAYGTAITVPENYVMQDLSAFNSITAHEFFHLWNVKRIRPQSLEPVDYTKENYTRALWFSEGVDSTVAGYIELRAGLLDERHYLDDFGRAITGFESEPAHLTQSAERSSLETWFEKYPYYNLPERSISYYTKGELLGVLLDLRMRAASHDQANLQMLFHWMNEHYAKAGKFFPDTEGVRQAAETLSHADLRDFFANYVSATQEIPWDTFFAPVGLRVTTVEATFVHRGFDAAERRDQPVVIVRVQPGSEADRAGLKAGDVVTKLNGRDVGRDFTKTLEALGVGAAVRLEIHRDGVQQEIQWTLGSRTQTVYRLEDIPGVTQEQRARRSAWLFGVDRKAQ